MLKYLYITFLSNFRCTFVCFDYNNPNLYRFLESLYEFQNKIIYQNITVE